MFAPLSPTSSRRLARIRKKQEQASTSTALVPISQPPPEDQEPDVTEDYEDEHHHQHRRRRHRRRRNSDPSSNRPHRHHERNASRSPSLDRNSDSSGAETEVLPDRFDAQGRPLDRHGKRDRERIAGGNGGGQQEMVEKLIGGFEEVVEGRKSWKDLLAGLLDGVNASGSDLSAGSRRRRR